MFWFKIPAFALINRAEMPCFPVTNIYIFLVPQTLEIVPRLAINKLPVQMLHVF